MNSTFHYSSERNVQILLSLLKAYGIKRVIASPGAINIPIVASMQQDSFFEMFSCVDERSAAYMACGMAEETGEPVVLSCTGATASRNYMPGMTEAYYRKLPVVALTSSRDSSWIGHLFPQVTNRLEHPGDIVVSFANIQTIKDDQDIWDVNIKLNRTLNDLKRGPVHINITDAVSRAYDVLELPPTKVIRRICSGDTMPSLPEGRVAVFCGEHKMWTDAETKAVDNFCASNDAVVLVDHTSKYHGKYRVLYSLIGSQDGYKSSLASFDLIIHIGEISGAYDIFGPVGCEARYVWRVNPDGEFRDLFHKLGMVFQMSEEEFFSHYSRQDAPKDGLLRECISEYSKIYNSLPDFPFSNIYIGKTIGQKFPNNSILYLGILNTLRSWNFFEINNTVKTFSNVGGFGIDGVMSSLIGASLVAKDRLCYAVIGDLSFFYDLNSLGNRNVDKNVRIMLINNGKGVEFRHFNHQARFMGDEADCYVAAAGHWGGQSPDLVRHYATDLGFDYISASNKKEFEEKVPKFLDPQIGDKPIVFEIFVSPEDDMASLKMLRLANYCDVSTSTKEKVKSLVKEIAGEKAIEIIKILKK